MQLKHVTPTLETLSNNGPVIVTGVKPTYEYKDGQRLDKVTGLTVEVVLPRNHYDTLSVKVSDPVDRLSAALETGEPVHVTFLGFTAKLYVMNGRGGVSAKADKVQIVDDTVVELIT